MFGFEVSFLFERTKDAVHKVLNHSQYSKTRSVRNSILIEHFTVVYSVTWPLNGSEAGSDLVLIKTSLFLLC